MTTHDPTSKIEEQRADLEAVAGSDLNTAYIAEALLKVAEEGADP